MDLLSSFSLCQVLYIYTYIVGFLLTLFRAALRVFNNLISSVSFTWNMMHTFKTLHPICIHRHLSLNPTFLYCHMFSTSFFLVLTCIAFYSFTWTWSVVEAKDNRSLYVECPRNNQSCKVHLTQNTAFYYLCWQDRCALWHCEGEKSNLIYLIVAILSIQDSDMMTKSTKGIWEKELFSGLSFKII